MLQPARCGGSTYKGPHGRLQRETGEYSAANNRASFFLVFFLVGEGGEFCIDGYSLITQGKFQSRKISFPHSVTPCPILVIPSA